MALLGTSKSPPSSSSKLILSNTFRSKVILVGKQEVKATFFKGIKSSTASPAGSVEGKTPPSFSTMDKYSLYRRTLVNGDAVIVSSPISVCYPCRFLSRCLESSLQPFALHPLRGISAPHSNPMHAAYPSIYLLQNGPLPLTSTPGCTHTAEIYPYSVYSCYTAHLFTSTPV
jgi:hypothetical protein